MRSPSFHALGPLASSVALLAGCTVTNTSPLHYEGCTGFGCSTSLDDHAIAAGATASIVSETGSTKISAASSDPSVLTIGSLDPAIFGGTSISAQGVAPGTSTLTVYDPSHHQVASAPVTVAATADIALDPGVEGTGVKVVAGHFALHATTMGSRGEVLAGNGAIHFSTTGVLHGDTSASLCEGDCVGFSVTGVGNGVVSMVAIGAARTLPFTAIDPATLNALAFAQASATTKANETVSVAYALHAGADLVYGNLTGCVSDSPQVADVAAGGTDGVSEFAQGVSGNVVIAGKKAGSATIRCAVGGATSSLTIVVTP
jgi:hypothetical protein